MLVVSTPSFNKDISKIKDSALARRVEHIIRALQSAHHLSEIKGIKKLSGAADAYRIRVADYRIGFTHHDQTIRLVIFAHRKDIYRFFP